MDSGAANVVSLTMQRRNYLKAAGGIAATVAAGGASILALSGGAAAQANGNFDYGSASVSSDDGTAEYVAVYGDSVVSWDGFDTPAQFFEIDIVGRVQGASGSETDLHSTGLVDLDNENWGNDEALSGPGTSGSIESAIGLDSNGDHDPATDWHIVGTDPDGYGLPANSIDPSYLEVDQDGDSQTFTVEKEITYTWYDSGQSEIHSKTWTATVDVTVTNEPATASTSDGPGEDGATAA